MYLMTCTRPELAYSLSILARYVAPGRHRPEHMVAAKRVLRYLCSTSGLGLVLGGRRPVVLTGHADASWAEDQATQRLSQGYTFSLGSGSVSWRSTRSSSVLGSCCEAEIYAGAMAAQELRWLTYLLADLGEPPRSPQVLYVDNKAMLALCWEHRVEHRTKHIALRYFLARELQQRGQLRLAYVASEANTADIFTKALPPSDHQRFCTMLACFALLCLTGLVTSCSPPLCLWGFSYLYPTHFLVHLFLVIFTLGFAPSTADPSLFLRTNTSLPPFFVLVYTHDLVFATADTEALTLVKSEQQKRHTCTDLGHSALRLPVLLAIAHSFVYHPLTLSSTFEQHTLSAFWLATWLPVGNESSSCEAEIYTGAMAAQQLRWLTYLLTDLGEQPRSPPVLYVDNKAMIALCQEHRLEHKTNHIALRYLLARELHQRCQLRLAYVATRANTADIFTKALPSGDHQRFSTVLGLVCTFPHLLTT
ncbi:unnamed protein product [Closterium sp. NIES-53]